MDCLFQAEPASGQNVLPHKMAAGGTEWNVRLGQSNILHVKVEYERPFPT